MEMMTFGLEDDLTQLDDLTEETILQRLKNRYGRDFIYTKVSDILIAVNPFKPVDLYGQEHHSKYRWNKFDENAKPHIFGVAAAAYRRMRESECDQVIIVSGESGAGKTESTKHMVKHMVHMCQGGDMELHDKIIKVNPLLEAFGNAKTVMNNNSSRYAKFLEISFQENGQLQGAVVRDYMLEKARVCHQARGEGTFHIFYAMFAGADRQKRRDLCLTQQTAEYRIMQSDDVSLEMESEYRERYTEIAGTLKQINVDIDVVQMMLAAVIHITEITFSESDAGVAEIDDAAPYVYAAELLNLNEVAFAESLIASKINIRGQDIVTFKSVKQAEDGRDALAKMLYERMFGWLVRSINQDLHPSKYRSGQETKIGILDIAGFEKLKKNSFEQMCINIVNEKLQNHTNERLFKVELDIYKEEGIEVQGIHFENNQATLELFTKQKTGLLAILDEQTKYQLGTDGSFIQLLNKQFKGNDLYTQSKGDLPKFAIKHFAGQVIYDADGFLEKNRDKLGTEMLNVMKESKDEFIADLFTVKRGPTGTISTTFKNWRASRVTQKGVQVLPKPKAVTKGGKVLADELGQTLKKRYGTVGMPTTGIERVAPTTDHTTLATYFQTSLMELVTKLKEAEPFFVRCIKPNPRLLPDDFMDSTVSDQLRYNGIAAVATIRRMGFSVRKPYTDFNPMYSCVLKNDADKKLGKREVARKILLSTPTEYHRDFRCGRSKVFMKEKVDLWLGKFRNITQNNASRVITRAIARYAAEERERKRQEEIKREEEERKRKEEERKRKEEERKRKDEEERKRKEEKKEPLRISGKKNQEPPGYDTADGQSGPSSAGSPFPQVPGPSSDPDTDSISSVGSDNNSDESSKGKRSPSPPIPHDLPQDPENKEKPEEGETSEPIAFWDIPQIIHREKRMKDVHEERSLQVIKVVTYFILFCVLLFCAVSQKLSLMILVSPQHQKYNGDRTKTQEQEKGEEHTESARYMLLLIAMLIPYGLIFLSSIFKWLFGTMPTPVKTTILFTGLMEALHTVGLCLLCFRVLPEVDIVNGILMLSAVAIIPSVLKPLASSEAKHLIPRYSTGKRVAIYALDVLAIIVQVVAIPVIVSQESRYMIDYYSGDDENEWMILIEAAFAMFLISFSWWENFMDDHFCGRLRSNSCWQRMVLKIKFDMQECRPIVSTFMSLWKIALSVLIAWLFRREIFHHFHEAFGTLYDKHIINNSAILTLTIAGFVGHYVAYTACKLQLQHFSFNLPLLLSTPLAVVVAILDCDTGLDLLGVFTSEKRSCLNVWVYSDKTTDHYTNDTVGWLSHDGDGYHHWFHLCFGFVWWLSLYWVARHIFYPRQERLAKTERLFLNPYYCGILFEQHLLLNRRRHNRKVKREFKEDKIYYRLSDYDTKMNVEGQEEDNVDGSTDTEYNAYNQKFKDVPMIYACATMWHENRQEMTQLMKSLFRMDRDQCLRRHAEMISGKRDPEFYDFEAHILFDDAMELNDDEKMVPNQFVKMTLSVMEEAASSVYERRMKIKDPIKIPSPYGGQLIWEMPGNNFLFIHLKDKTKIRHRKRWSQVMYMYYLLGFRIIRCCQETVTAALNSNKLNELMNWGEVSQTGVGQVGRSAIFQTFDETVERKAANTFILALDGDVDFTPGAVRLLLDRMRKSEKVGAACGRIHPIGSGPVVWFQMFEYATAHWLQKATEHVLGCVLCSPGCFSLFRGSALMDDNVMKKYTILPTEPTHHLMYDQGEDRWLCTLLLQQGYRVDYAAASDAFTYAPEGFAEFFNQRRRWMPSTVANIADLLADYKNTVYINSNISMLYIIYQFSLLLSTVVGPATVLMMIASASLIVFQTNLFQSYLVAVLPALFYFILCLTVKPKWQIMVAEIMSGIYAFIMMIVLVGTIVTAAENSPFHPSVIFIGVLVLIFLFAAILHPKEWSCAVYGILYYLMVPTGFLILIIYSICNLHVVSWGTREVPKKKSKAEIEEEKRKEEEKKRKKKERGFFGRFFPQSPIKEMKDIIAKITDIQGPKKQDDANTRLLEKICDGIDTLVKQQSVEKVPAPKAEPEVRFEIEASQHDEAGEEKPKGIMKKKTDAAQKKEKRTSFCDTVSTTQLGTGEVAEEPIYDKSRERERDELKNPFWAEDKDLGTGEVMEMMEEEKLFWKGFIKKYLYPLEMTPEQKKQNHKSMIKLRNDVALGFAMINLLWIAINFMFQLSQPTKVTIPLSTPTGDEELTEEDEEVQTDYLVQVDVLGLLFIIFFAVVLLIQFVGMIIHRWGTFLHLVSITQLRNPLKTVKDINVEEGKTAIKPKEAMAIAETILNEPLPDYSDESDSEEQERKTEMKEEVKRLMTTGARFGISVGENGILGASTRKLGTSTRQLRDTSRLTEIGNTIRDAQRVVSRFDSAPEREALKQRLQDEARKAKDSKYKDRELPPIREKSNFDLSPGQKGLVKIMKERNMHVRFLDVATSQEDRPQIPEADDDDTYDFIPGTVGRQMGKRLKLMSKQSSRRQPNSSMIY